VTSKAIRIETNVKAIVYCRNLIQPNRGTIGFKINCMCKIGFPGYVCILAWLCDYLSWFLSEI